MIYRIIQGVAINTIVFGDINKAENSSGIYFDQKNKRVVLSSADERAVKIFKYNSCYDIKYERTIELPKKLPKISRSND